MKEKAGPELAPLQCIISMFGSLNAVVVVLAAATQVPLHGAEPECLDKFKAFVAKPSPIRNITYTHTYPGRTDRYPPTHVLARLDEDVNAFLRIKSHDSNEVFRTNIQTNPENLQGVGRYGTNVWRIDPGEIYYWNTEIREIQASQEVGGRTRRVSTAIRARDALESHSKYLAQILNMGVHHAPEGIDWEGNRFVIHTPERNVEGQLIPDDKGRAGQLEVTIREKDPQNSKQMRLHWWRMEYEYNDGDCLPDVITTYALDEDREPRKLLERFTIHGLQRAKPPLSEELFLPKHYVADTNSLKTYLTTKEGTKTWDEAQQRWRYILAKDDPFIDKSVVSSVPWTKWVVFAVPFFIVMTLLKFALDRRKAEKLGNK